MQTKKVHKAETRLMNALLELVAEGCNVADVSVSDLCQKAGVSRTAFYAYYDNISSVVIAMEDRAIEKSMGPIRFIFENPEKEQESRELIFKYNAHILSHRDHVVGLLQCNIGLTFVGRMIDNVVEIIHSKFEGTSFSEVRERVAAYAFVSFMRHLILTGEIQTTDYYPFLKEWSTKVIAFGNKPGMM